MGTITIIEVDRLETMEACIEAVVVAVVIITIIDRGAGMLVEVTEVVEEVDEGEEEACRKNYGTTIRIKP